MQKEDTKPQEIEEELRKAYTHVCQNFVREPFQELGIIRDKLWEAYQNDRMGSDPVFAKFMYEELMPAFCPKIETEYGLKAEVRYILTC